MGVSVCQDPNGRKRLLVDVGRFGRHPIRLGKMSLQDAQAVARFVVNLLSARAAGGIPDPQTAAWLQKIPAELYDKLAKLELVPASKRVTSLGAMVEQFFATLPRVKPGTMWTYNHVRRCLLAFFGAGRLVRSIEREDADKFRAWLKDDQRLADATIARRIKTARQMFKQAMGWRLVLENPFAGVKAGSEKNKDREFFITREMAAQVLAACPDSQWRLLFALSRFGGLRCPSEHLSLTWGDVDWERARVRVRSPKTEHHAGGESRIIPLFPELRPHLQAAFDEAADGEVHVITRYRDRGCNLRTQLERIIKRAGLEPWPRLFQNLRSSRQTELAESHPAHVVCAWIGNSEAVARDHYLQVRDEYFVNAAAGRVNVDLRSGVNAAGGGVSDYRAEAAQNPAQKGSESGRTGPQAGLETCDFPKDSVACDPMRTLKVVRD